MKWSEVLELPFETKVRLPWWSDSAWVRLRRNIDGCILFEYDDFFPQFRKCFCEITLQDQWELYKE